MAPIIQLHPQRTFPTSEGPTLAVGHRYTLRPQPSIAEDSVHGLIGGYRISPQSATIVPLQHSDADVPAYFWDPDCDLTAVAGTVTTAPGASPIPLSDCRLRHNRLMLDQTNLSGPELDVSAQTACLTLSPRFDFTFSTDACAARLGMLHLVQAQRFMILESGRQVTLLDCGQTETSVLYLEDAVADTPLTWLSPVQAAGTTQSYRVDVTVAQPIDEQLESETVVSVTVLERYRSYLMQRASPEDDDTTLWTPVYPALSWGWSIRVGRRPDGDWAIMRRKLMLPISDHDGLQLPHWQNNTFTCAATPSGEP